MKVLIGLLSAAQAIPYTANYETETEWWTHAPLPTLPPRPDCKITFK